MYHEHVCLTCNVSTSDLLRYRWPVRHIINTRSEILLRNVTGFTVFKELDKINLKTVFNDQENSKIIMFHSKTISSYHDYDVGDPLDTYER